MLKFRKIIKMFNHLIIKIKDKIAKIKHKVNEYF